MTRHENKEEEANDPDQPSLKFSIFFGKSLKHPTTYGGRLHHP